MSRSRALVIAAAVTVLCVFAGCSLPTAQPPADLGRARWRWRPPPDASIGMPAADGDGVVATFSHLFLVSLAPDGAERWRARRLGVRDETPLLTADVVVVPADDGLVAFERATGRVRWDTNLGGNVETPDPDDAASTPVRAGNSVLVCLAGGALVAVDVDSGSVRWRTPLAGRCEGPPASDGRTVVATWDPERGDDAGIAAFDVATGERRWTAGLHAGAVSGPTIAGGNGHPFAVVIDHDLAAKAFDLADGRRLWTTSVAGGGSPEVPPRALDNGQMLVADRLAGLTLLDAGGHRLWSARVHAAAVQGGPVGPTAAGLYALPLYDGKVLVAGPKHASKLLDAPGGLVSGVAVGPGGGVSVSSAQGRDNQLAVFGD